MAIGVLAGAGLLGLYVRGGGLWVLGFVALVPWLRSLDAAAGMARTLLSAWALTVAFSATAFHWFGTAIGSFTHLGEAAGLVVLLLAAPLLQPQLIAYALVRQLVGRHYGALVRAAAGAAAWVATEAFAPKLLGDTLGHGLYPAAWLRQAADLGGAAGLTVLLLLANEGLVAALARRSLGLRAVAAPLALAALLPLLAAGYGWQRLAAAPPPATGTLRMGLVQSAIVDYERLRQEKGAGAVVREVLDTHYAMSYDAVERQRAQAVLWSETVYPTTFGQPKSQAGAELDREILQIVNAAGVPFVFGTYDRDDAGEYNAAAFVAPRDGLVGFYRKTHLFPLTEALPGWLDGPLLRRWLPWAGQWRPGNGARVLPLRLADGREVPALPLICLDDVDPALAIDGARLGAAVILTMSNDSWFSAYPLGAELHQAVAAFRSIETRLPQFRVTSNGFSAAIDATGTVVAGSRMGERTLVIGDVPLREPPRTLMVAWGDWVGRAGAALLGVLAVGAALRGWRARFGGTTAATPIGLPPRVHLLPPAARLAAAALRGIAGASLLAMALAVLVGESAWLANPLGQIRHFVVLVLLPEVAARSLLRAYVARLGVEPGALVLSRDGQRVELPLAGMTALRPWCWPLPCAGARLQMAGEAQPRTLAGVEPMALWRAVVAAGGNPTLEMTGWTRAWAEARAAVRPSRFDRAWIRFGLLPLLLAVPAYRLHQNIAYGASLGEAYTFGWLAFVQGFVLWWAAWVIGVAVCAAVLRAAVEVVTVAAALLRPDAAAPVRHGLDRAALALLYLGLPAWLLMRVLGV